MRGRHGIRCLLIAVVVAGCGGGGGTTTAGRGSSAGPSGPLAGAGRSGLEHIHGLAVRAGRLYIATHAGLWSVRERGGSAARVGDSRQDLMAFSVAADGAFVASGHPAPDQGDLPPNLGLVRSADRGRSWQPVSLLGQADFHILESRGRRVIGFDGTQARLMLSDNGGATWQQRSAPAEIFDIAMDPRRPARMVAATAAGLVVSGNGAVDWLQLRNDVAGLIAWPRRDRLYLVGGDGTVAVSADAARSLRPVGTVGGQPVAFTASGSRLYVALADNSIKRSTDGGRTWTVRVGSR